MNKPVTLLYVEDDDLDRRAFLRLVREKGLPWEVTLAETLAAARARLAQSRFDLIVADCHLPDGRCTELFDEVPDIPFVLLTGAPEEQLALRTLERGADDYLPKDPERRHLEALPSAVEKTLHRKRILERERQLAQELRQSEQRLRATFDNAASGIVQTDDRDRLVVVNDHICQMLGYAREELLGMNVHDLTYPEDRPRSDELNAQLHEGRLRLLQYEKRYLKRDGSPLWVQVGISAARDEAGRYLYSVGTVVDISARKAAEAQVRLQAAALAAAPNAISLSKTDPEGTIVWVNPAFTALTGYRPEEAIGQSHHILSSGQQDEAFYRQLWETIRRGEVWRGELVNRRKDGTLYQEEMGVTPLRDEAGNITHYVAIKQDITARKRAEEELASVAQFPEENPNPVLRIGRDGRVPYANQSAVALLAELGWQREGPVPQTIRTAVEQMVESGTAREWELECCQDRTVAFVCVPVPEKGYVNLYGRDVTERRRVEKALRDSELFYRQTLESIPGMVFTTRPDGYCDYQSQQWVDFTGVPMSEHLGDGWNQLLHPDDRPRAYAAWRAAVEGTAPYDLEYRVRRHDGQYEWFKVLGRPIRDAAGQIVRWFGVAANIDALKQTEQQLKALTETLEQRVTERTAEAEARSAQLRELAVELTRAEQRERRRLAQVLHDHLQQLLVGAKFGTSILRSQLAGNDDTLQHLQHVDDLLDESILTSRSLTVELSPPILAEGGLVPALRWLAGWMQEKHGLQVQVEADEAANPADDEIRTLLFQSVRELLFNVVKHAKVKTALVTADRYCRDQVRIVVADQGVGFDPDTTQRRIDASTGLGLLSMQERLEAMGSRLQIESAPGKGSRMTLVAPLHLHELPETAVPAAETPAATPAPATAPRAASRAGCIRVLIADDHTVVRDGMSRLLQMHGDIEVVGTAADGQEAVELSSQLQPDVVLMDVSMPRLNGIEATRQLHRQMRHICIIGLSMHGEEETALRMREAGAVHYLTKTMPPQQVIAAIRSCARGA